jgi:hypothetical protein
MANGKIELGEKIRDAVFAGNAYAQLAVMRETIKALETRTNPLATAAEKAEAEEIIAYSKAVNAEIEKVLAESL